MDVVFGTLVFIVVSFLFVFALLRFRDPLRRFRDGHVPPGPYGIPVLGYLPWIDPKAPHLTLTRLTKLYGPIYSIKMGNVFTVVLSDHRLIRQAFAKDVFTGRAPLYLTHGIMKGYGLICAEGELWKDQRKFVSTSLKNFGMVKFGVKREKMEQRIQVGVQDCLEKISEQTEEPQEILPILLHCLGNVMNSLVFGLVYQQDDPTWKWLQHLQEEGTKHIGVAGPVNFLPFLRFIPHFKKTINFLMEGKLKTHALYQEIINSHKLEKKEEEANNFVDAFLNEKARRGEEQFYSTPQFHHLLADMFGAGLDTTMTTLRWFILFMAEYSTIQKKVQEELDSLIGRRLPSLEDIPHLPNTEAALAETQRIRSVTPLGIPHGTLEDTTLAGYHIPKGSMVVPLQWAVHMDPEEWAEPEIFIPERFLTEDGRFNKPESFIPFQTGKRMCVGEELARMMLFLFGATIIHRFTISPAKDVDLDLEGECGITLTPKTQKLLFTPRF